MNSSIVMVTLNHPRGIVDLTYAHSPGQVAEWRTRGYLPLEEWRALPGEVKRLTKLAEEQAKLIESLLREA